VVSVQQGKTLPCYLPERPTRRASKRKLFVRSKKKTLLSSKKGYAEKRWGRLPGRIERRPVTLKGPRVGEKGQLKEEHIIDGREKKSMSPYIVRCHQRHRKKVGKRRESQELGKTIVP